MKQLLVCGVLMSCLSRGAPAQAPSAPASPDAARLAVARRVLEASGAAQTMVDAVRASLPSQRAATPQLPEAFWIAVEERVVRDAPGLTDSIAVLYSALFSKEELDQLLAFYASPIGRRFRDLQPRLLTESSAIGQRWGARMGADVVAELQQSGALPKP